MVYANAAFTSRQYQYLIIQQLDHITKVVTYFNNDNTDENSLSYILSLYCLIIYNLTVENLSNSNYDLSVALPHIIQYIKLNADINMGFGALVNAFGKSSEEKLEHFLRKNSIDFLFDLDSEDDIDALLSSAFTSLAKNKVGQELLTSKMDLTKSKLSEDKKCKIARILSSCSSVPSLLSAVSKLVQTTSEGSSFFALMEGVRNMLHASSKNGIDKENANFEMNQTKELANITLKIANTKFKDNREVKDWIEWFEQEVTGLVKQSPYLVRLSPLKSVDCFISPNGNSMRTKYNSDFCTTVANHCASRGKVYYEVELHSSCLYQIGWVTESFKHNSKNGEGVGDDKYSWAVDLYRNSKWHNGIGKVYDEENDVKWEKGGIVQLYADLDQRKLYFGYNGTKSLGYKNINIENGLYPALSCVQSGSCTFNFGESGPFRFNPGSDYKKFSEAVNFK
eukprot:TRINITY_DN5030_c0_g1_i2.p1 TRINITY_DN5030_c0_g1~~TRINITY_DN5030_c0_g1_i2.p1  ORF type:complete len:452 (+),score=94.01 TRINITY_DN5030_c0_g1_i2:1285-2640(+)